MSSIDGDQKRRGSHGRGAGWSYRSYTDDDRAQAMVAYYASGGNLRRTAGQLGIPVTTLRKWVKDDVKPPDPRRVLIAGAALEAKLEAYLDRAFAIDPAEFPRNSFLEFTQAIALLVDMLVKLRAGCDPVAARMAAATRPPGRPLDLTRASEAELAALRAWLDRRIREADATPPVAGGQKANGRG